MDVIHQTCSVKSAVLSLPGNGSDGRNHSELLFTILRCNLLHYSFMGCPLLILMLLLTITTPSVARAIPMAFSSSDMR
jgi:hypothetical protein